MDASLLADQIGTALRARATPGRAERERAYLKSELEHYGTNVPIIRSVAKAIASQHPALSHDDLLALVGALWAAPVHERRMAAVELLDRPRPRSWSLSRGPSLIDSDLTGAARTAEVPGQAAEEASGGETNSQHS